MSVDKKWLESLCAELSSLEDRFSKSRKRWNFWYYLSLYGSIFMSAISALILKSEIILNTAVKNDLAALFATIAALLGTAMTTGNFERRWTAARIARTTVHKLKVAITKPDANLGEVSKEMEKLMDDYTRQVIGNDE